MSESKTEQDNKTEESITRKQLAELLNGDLSREIPGDHCVRGVLASAQRSPVYECR